MPLDCSYGTAFDGRVALTDSKDMFSSYWLATSRSSCSKEGPLRGNLSVTLKNCPYKASTPTFTASSSLLNIATCPGARGALARHNFDVPVWRVRYFGEWPNLNPFPWLHAYHSSDIPMIFNTADLLGPDTLAEKATSEYYQEAWAAFARAPANGLDKLGWPRYDPTTNSLIKLGFENSTEAEFGPGTEFDALCSS
ncbi:hypothetical protein K469DRAFT_692976 [Zopfia rhizophila CBS 207.26]|uniref:Uncharacterized protein n=1 Tax=Zopfia rhizophila CBS 207.26 TaxID=1314779 RepID=A0A6A6EQ02_9PEZI|nr:hypothetical protein K469DRAFT_692976 [Zopfia rhizophila CBS 207.26]